MRVRIEDAWLTEDRANPAAPKPILAVRFSVAELGITEDIFVSPEITLERLKAEIAKRLPKLHMFKGKEWEL